MNLTTVACATMPGDKKFLNMDSKRFCKEASEILILSN
jgi:hypothetical protein